jgi:hypothetical protein
MKNCSKKDCNQVNPQSLDNFYKHRSHKDGLASHCKSCDKKSCKKFKENNKALVKQLNINWRDKNKEVLQTRRKEYYELNREEVIQRNNNYNNKNREKVRKRKTAQSKKKREENPLFRMAFNLRRRTNLAFKKIIKSKKTTDLLGCSMETAFVHIESQFYCHPITGENMTWGNYGKLWEIDHKDPIGLAGTREELEKLCHYTNLQPLWKEDHKIKTAIDNKRIKLNKNNKLLTNTTSV